MSPEERIIALEGELLDLERGAVRLLLTVAHAVASSTEDRQDLALFIAAAGSGHDPVTARLARVAGQAIHRGKIVEHA